MRISDWSSDVCSSDLNGADCTMDSEKVTTINLDHGTSGSTPWTYTCPRNTVEAVNGAFAPLNDAHYFGHVVFDMYSDYLQTSPLTGKVTLKEIGRASCRERVCQYV